jgi:acetyl esterase/lipase
MSQERIRLRRCLLPAVVAVVVLTGSGCFPLLRPEGAAPLRYRDAVFTDVTKVSDITYGSAVNLRGDTVTLRLDRYTPTGDTVRGRPAVVWVHGGGFCCGDKTDAEIVDEAKTFAKKGYVNVSINYRLEPGGCNAGSPTPTCVGAIREALDDAQRAVRFLRRNAESYGVDPERIAIAGTSAGGITALNVGYSSAEEPASAVQAAVSLSGANVLTTVGEGDAPAFLLHGSTDTVVPYQWALNTVDAAKAAGLYVFLTTWEGEGHVPYVAHRAQILDQTSNFLYWELDLENAPR